MPNHTANTLQLTGDSKQITEFIKACIKTTKDEDTQLDFNGVVPMPEELITTTSPTSIMTEKEIKKQWDDFNKLPKDKQYGDKPFGLGLTKKQSNALIKKYGTNNWYDWAVKNWGTKWNAYDIGEWDGGFISFHTAWSPPTEFIINASKKFPDVSFLNKFADEGGGFVGYTEIKNGKLVSDVSLDWDKGEGKELRDELGYGDFEDEEDSE